MSIISIKKKESDTTIAKGSKPNLDFDFKRKDELQFKSGFSFQGGFP